MCFLPYFKQIKFWVERNFFKKKRKVLVALPVEGFPEFTCVDVETLPVEVRLLARASDAGWFSKIQVKSCH